MESLINTAKRKKRKTRKCLDNIRKRSRQSGQIVFDKDNGKVCDLYSTNSKIKKCLITNNRLTLRMFPKTVRSETITRPALTDLKQKQYLNLDELINGSNVLGTTNSSNVRLPELIDTFDKNIENLNKENVKLISSKCALNESSICEVPVSKTIDKEDELSKNMNQFSYLYSNEITDKSPDSLGGQSVSTVTTPSSIHDEYGYKLYEDFMSEIPIYLHNATFIKEDVIQKTKVYLQHLFIESCYQECEDNVWKCIKNNNTTEIFYAPTEMIVHNPMDYIRLGNVQHQNPFRQSTKLGGTIVASLGTPHSPLIAPPSPPASPDTSSNVNMHDTPDYSYYPHRLN